MGYIYFTRHGQTVWNVENKICGATDIELTEKGTGRQKSLGSGYWEKGCASMRSSARLWCALRRLRGTSRRSPVSPCASSSA